MEDIAKLNHQLRVPNQQTAVLRSSLEQLSQKLPSREILKSTKIGYSICWRLYTALHISLAEMKVIGDMAAGLLARLKCLTASVPDQLVD